ncbi:GyrI-like domain-containing protein [Neisseriaceae bacterium JH1-16]|nr:GyrI-like domain-containing protein [Neisseriaceae bacterium JH1-16]
MLDPMQIVEVPRRLAAVIRLTVPREQIQQVMGPAHRELLAAVAAQGVATTGPWFCHHLRLAPALFDFELGVTVATPVAPAGRVQPGELPATTVARTVYHGPYEGLADAWGEFMGRIAAAGYAAAPDLWECYVSGPEASPDPAQWRTEFNRPLLC